jgi:hypothetical protein
MPRGFDFGAKRGWACGVLLAVAERWRHAVGCAGGIRGG